MAITHDYVDFATGNDYKGASFVDGAYTSATKTLVKAGAFAATKANHYLYLESNDGGSIVAGYYKVATVPDANTVTLATDAGAGVDDDAVKCTQHDGTTTKPWRSLQGAFDLCTRNTTDGNQVNLKAGTAHVNAASLDLTTFIAAGALAAAAPLIVRGYTAAANDGGIGEIDCNGATMWAATTYDYVALVELKVHNGGNNNLVDLDQSCLIYRCEVYQGASTPSAKRLINLGANGLMVGCYIHDQGAGGSFGAIGAAPFHAIGNYVDMGQSGQSAEGIRGGRRSVIWGNIVRCSSAVSASFTGISALEAQILHNIVYSTVACTGKGINALGVGTIGGSVTLNNIVVGISGAGGIGISSNGAIVGYNAYYNNADDYAATDVEWVDLTANDVTLAADPFTDAANGDFSLTTAGKAALRSLGWPASYLGAHANTDPHITIGPMQYGPTPAATGAVAISPALGRFL